eukprot:s1749_g5.t2
MSRMSGVRLCTTGTSITFKQHGLRKCDSVTHCATIHFAALRILGECVPVQAKKRQVPQRHATACAVPLASALSNNLPTVKQWLVSFGILGDPNAFSADRIRGSFFAAQVGTDAGRFWVWAYACKALRL